MVGISKGVLLLLCIFLLLVIYLVFTFSLEVLHENKVTHTDLKPENILFVDSDFTMTYNVEKVSMEELERICACCLT